MGIHYRSVLTFFSCKRKLLFLALTWTAGLFAGVIFAWQSGDIFLLMMRMAASSRVSIPGLIASAYLPFLLAFFAVYISQPRLLYMLCFLKAFFFIWCGCCACFAFGSAGWLVRLLLQFSDCCLIPLLCWFCIRHISGSHRNLKRDFFLVSVAAAVVITTDYCAVSPFLAMLIDI